MIGETVGHYRVLNKLGGGGMGVVYKGRDTRLGRLVALKFLPEKYFDNAQARERFQREARAASALNHPNICTIYDLGEHAGQPFIVMEFLQGKSLKQYLSSQPMDLGTRLDICAQVAEGLQAAHTARIIHRDIKPANIFVTDTGRVKLVDFGLAKLTEEPLDVGSAPTQSLNESPDDPLTAPGTLVGTIKYMAPEQALGQPVDARSDLFSLGVVLYEMTTGQLPFTGKTEAAFFEKLAHQKPQSPRSLNRSISSETESVVLRSLEKDPKKRFQNANVFRTALIRSAQRRRWLPPAWRWVLRSAIFLIVMFMLVQWFGDQKPDWFENLRFFGPTVQDIAVLPFEMSGLDVKDEEAWRGLFKDLTNTLTRMQQFDRNVRMVSAREISTMKVTSPSEARRAFGATLTVDGRVVWTGEYLRITLNLIDAVTIRQLDSRLITDPERDFLLVRERVLEALVKLLEVNLGPETFSVLAATGTVISEAYEHYLRGLDYLERGDVPGNIERSIAELKLATEEDPSFAQGYAALTRAYSRQFTDTREPAWLEEAEESCQQALDLDSDLADAHVACSTIDSDRGRYEEAVAGYRTAIRLDPTNSNAQRRLAFALARVGEFEEAVSIWTTAIELDQDYWVNYYELGTFYLLNNRSEEAKVPLRRALGLVPENYQIHGNLGSAFLQQERLNEAKEYYLASAEIQLNYPALSNLGTIYYRQGKFAESAENYEAALELRDSDYMVWGNLAYACQKIPEREHEAPGYFERAAEMSRRLLEINHREINATLNLATYYMQLERYEDGFQLLDKARESDPLNSELMMQTGNLYEVTGDRESAITWILKALQSGFPNDRLEKLSDLDELRKDADFQRQLKELFETPDNPADVNQP